MYSHWNWDKKVTHMATIFKAHSNCTCCCKCRSFFNRVLSPHGRHGITNPGDTGLADYLLFEPKYQAIAQSNVDLPSMRHLAIIPWLVKTKKRIIYLQNGCFKPVRFHFSSELLCIKELVTNKSVIRSTSAFRILVIRSLTCLFIEHTYLHFRRNIE